MSNNNNKLGKENNKYKKLKILLKFKMIFRTKILIKRGKKGNKGKNQYKNNKKTLKMILVRILMTNMMMILMFQR